MQREAPGLWSAEAEVAVLAAVLTDPACLPKIDLTAEDFHEPRWRAVYDAISASVEQGYALDPVTVLSALQAAGHDHARALEWLRTLGEAFTLLDNLDHHVRVLRDRTRRRRLVATARAIIEQAADTTTTDELIDTATEQVLDLSATSSTAARTFSQLIIDSVQHSEMRRSGAIPSGLPTGFHALDHLTAGLQRTDLIIVAGRPSMGKTAFATQLAVNAAFSGHPVAFASIEMSARGLADRIICGHANVSLVDYRSGNLDPDAPIRLNQASNVLHKLPLYIDDRATSLSDIRAYARRLRRTHNIEMLIVDYLTLVRPPRSAGENRVQQIGAITRAFKALAKELDIAVLLISQLSRAPEHRADARPILSDLRESGDIEQDADLVLFPFRPSYYKPNGNNDAAEIIVAKQRNGPTGLVRCTFDAHRVRFADAILASTTPPLRDNADAPATMYYDA